MVEGGGEDLSDDGVDVGGGALGEGEPGEVFAALAALRVLRVGAGVGEDEPGDSVGRGAPEFECDHAAERGADDDGGLVDVECIEYAECIKGKVADGDGGGGCGGCGGGDGGAFTKAAEVGEDGAEAGGKVAGGVGVHERGEGESVEEEDGCAAADRVEGEVGGGREGEEHGGA